MYGMSAHPRRVDIVSARVGVSSRPGPGERLLIESPSEGDIRATDARHPGRVLIEDIATWARKYPIGAKGWLRRYHVDDVPSGAWVLSHCIARLLCGRGLVGSAVVQIGSPPLPGGEPGLPRDAALCQVGRRTLVVDLPESRVIEIDPAIANVLNGGTDCVGSQLKRMD
jgi:hypothetical protein